MTHELTVKNGAAEMAYTGETPWHGLGNVLQPGATIEEWIAAAGMDWRITRARVRYAIERGADPANYREFSDRVVLFRGDDKSPLGIVSDAFCVVQPREVIEFFRDLVGAAGMELETAGTLFGGRKFWAMAALKDKSAVVADQRDSIKQNLLLATACDGSMATEGAWIATRVVCNNTLQIGRGEAGAIRVKVRHSTRFDSKSVKADLGVEAAQSVFESTVQRMRELAAIHVRPEQVVTATARLFNPDYDDMDSDRQAKVLRSAPVQAIGRLALDHTAIGSDMDGTNGTAYGWLNAVTEYVDHAGRARSVDGRLDSAWFGKGATLKEQAFAMAPTLADVIASTNAAMEAARAPSTGSSLLDAAIEETVL